MINMVPVDWHHWPFPLVPVLVSGITIIHSTMCNMMGLCPSYEMVPGYDVCAIMRAGELCCDSPWRSAGDGGVTGQSWEGRRVVCHRWSLGQWLAQPATTAFYSHYFGGQIPCGSCPFFQILIFPSLVYCFPFSLPLSTASLFPFPTTCRSWVQHPINWFIIAWIDNSKDRETGGLILPEGEINYIWKKSPSLMENRYHQLGSRGMSKPITYQLLNIDPWDG